jgi:Tfp pilus assembly protein PilF
MNYYISKTELNIAIKSLTNSLKYYYSNEYHLALKELDKTIKYLPNLAAAYARRGSIYYKLGNLERATINWNHALQLDPEYEDVKNILLKVKTDNIDFNNTLPE